jgi:hypothetical protein
LSIPRNKRSNGDLKDLADFRKFFGGVAFTPSLVLSSFDGTEPVLHIKGGVIVKP